MLLYQDYNYIFDNIKIKEKLKKNEIKINKDITKIYGNIPIDFNFNLEGNYLFYGYDHKYLTHSIHSYPAKFIPEIPRYLINKYSNEGDIILDPFNGSGTTILEAMLLNRIGIGLEIDPLAKLISKVKLTAINELRLNELKYDLLNWIKNIKYINYNLYNNYLDYWFDKKVIDELLIIKEWILTINDELINNFLWIIFSSIIKECSKANQKNMKTFISSKNPNKLNLYDAFNLFFKRLEEGIISVNKLNNLNLPYQSYIENDSNALNIKLNHKINLAITSPPYVNAVDYPRNHILELYWLDMIDNNINEMKKKYVGHEIFNKNQYESLKHFHNFDEINNILLNIWNEDKKRSFICYQYLIDMEKNLNEVYNNLVNGGKYCIIIGNNWIKNHNFETHKYLLQIAENIGFNINNYYKSEVIKHFNKFGGVNKIKTDWILVLNK